MVSGEGESITYDELSNILLRGTKQYTYQEPKQSNQNQNRLLKFENGATTY